MQAWAVLFLLFILRWVTLMVKIFYIFFFAFPWNESWMPNGKSCRISDSNGGIEKPTIKHMGIKIIVRSVGGHDRRQIGTNQCALLQHPGRQFDVLPAWVTLPYLSLNVQHRIVPSVKCWECGRECVAQQLPLVHLCCTNNTPIFWINPYCRILEINNSTTCVSIPSRFLLAATEWKHSNL